MLSTGIDLQLLDDAASEWPLGGIPQTARRITSSGCLSASPSPGASSFRQIQAVVVIDLVFELVASQANLLGIEDDNKITTVNVRG